MDGVDPVGIAAAYEALAVRLPGLAAAAPPEAVAFAFAAMLKDRAARGIGCEVRVEWPEGPAWLAARLHLRYALGDVGPQAGWVLSTLGAPSLVNLEDRSRHMLDRLPPSMLLAEEGGAVRAADVSPRGDPEVEREALMAGCLLASARSAAGRPVVPDGVPSGAGFHQPPFGPAERRGAWSLAGVPSPYLEAPATTLGLGDTFAGGCLLIVGSASRRSSRPRAARPA